MTSLAGKATNGNGNSFEDEADSSVVSHDSALDDEANFDEEEDQESDFNPTAAREKAAADEQTNILAGKESVAVFTLRIVVFLALFMPAGLVSAGVYMYTRNDEEQEFEDQVESNANMIINSFNDALERRIGAINTLSTVITSYALANNHTFPFVTVPHFAQLGADMRVQADAFVVHYTPYITDATRSAWEDYALEHRGHIDQAFVEDQEMRLFQDQDLGYTEDDNSEHHQGSHHADRSLAGGDAEQEPDPNVLQDCTGYHLRIWSNGTRTPKGAEPEGTGQFMPFWQRSPINPSKQKILNLNFDNTPAVNGVLPYLLEGKAVLARTIVPIPAMQQQAASNLKIGQYRHDYEETVQDPITFFGYPVFTSFDRKTRQLGGALWSNLYWGMLFDDILMSRSVGYICVLSNSFNQTVSYRLDGGTATWMGAGDLHDPKFNYLGVTAQLNANVQRRHLPRRART